jgi:hypothetical protein
MTVPSNKIFESNEKRFRAGEGGAAGSGFVYLRSTYVPE